jgi:hypothetical protein
VDVGHKAAEGGSDRVNLRNPSNRINDHENVVWELVQLTEQGVSDPATVRATVEAVSSMLETSPIRGSCVVTSDQVIGLEADRTPLSDEVISESALACRDPP